MAAGPALCRTLPVRLCPALQHHTPPLRQGQWPCSHLVAEEFLDHGCIFWELDRTSLKHPVMHVLLHHTSSGSKVMDMLGPVPILVLHS